MSDRIPLLIDTDPGVDDALAILMALDDAGHEVVGLTIAAGNVGLRHTVANALKLCEVAGRDDIPVFAGCPEPLLHPAPDAADVHGADGFGGTEGLDHVQCTPVVGGALGEHECERDHRQQHQAAPVHGVPPLPGRGAVGVCTACTRFVGPHLATGQTARVPRHDADAGRRGATWCGHCPKCQFVFVLMAPRLGRDEVETIFGRNLFEDTDSRAEFEDILGVGAHKPFECVGEGRESRAAMQAVAQRPEWREDVVVARYRAEVQPLLPPGDLDIDRVMDWHGEHGIPDDLAERLRAHFAA